MRATNLLSAFRGIEKCSHALARSLLNQVTAKIDHLDGNGETAFPCIC
jgi:hypothetical protein